MSATPLFGIKTGINLTPDKPYLKPGDPRKGDLDQVTWIELIPISETRNYVQRVLEGIFMYAVILEGEKNITSGHVKFF